MYQQPHTYRTNRSAMEIPDPAQQPFMDVGPVAEIFGIGRSLAYDQIRQGTFPLPVVRFGHRIKIPTRAVLEAAGLG